jgi:hypothetical protein
MPPHRTAVQESGRSHFPDAVWVRGQKTTERPLQAAILPGAVKKSHDRLCAVGRTVEIGTPITTTIA